MKKLCIQCIVVILAMMLLVQAVEAEPDHPDWQSAALYDLIKHRNEMSIEEKTHQPLAGLDICEKSITETGNKAISAQMDTDDGNEMAIEEKTRPPELPWCERSITETGNNTISDRLDTISYWLDSGDGYEERIVEQIKLLIGYQHVHNKRLADWASDDAQFEVYLSPLRMTAEKIKSIKNKKFPCILSYVAVHWYLQGMALNLHNHPIPAEALELVPNQWRTGDEHLQIYAFFSLLRKACHVNRFDQDFINSETGYQQFWNIPGRQISFPRWNTPNYYQYYYIPFNIAPETDDRPLCAQVVRLCLLSTQEADMTEFYHRKLSFFRTVLAEASRDESITVSAGPYMGLYSFTCRSLPCICVFKPGTSADRKYLAWKHGFSQEHPAEGVFNTDSPFGRAFNLLNLLPTSGACDLFSPIFLLQAGLKKDNYFSSPDFPYEVSSVGFKGYLDFYRELCK